MSVSRSKILYKQIQRRYSFLVTQNFCTPNAVGGALIPLKFGNAEVLVALLRFIVKVIQKSATMGFNELKQPASAK